MSQTKVQLVSGTTAQDLTVDNINTTSINSGQVSGRKNLIINGAFRIAQRGTSSTTSGYGSVDRFQCNFSGADEAMTHTQHTLTSSDTGPYAQGFRKSFHVQNGNQTSGAGAGDWMRIWHKFEAQDIANSGWDYTSPSSYLTLSFWVKVSVAQTYYVQLATQDGTSKMYYFAMTLSANTWTKITHSIPGHADLTFDNNNEEGLYIAWYAFRGTNNTGSGEAANQWNNFNGSALTPDQTTTWWTTNDSTYEITGVQLEKGLTATDFEHRSFAEELNLCQRYYQQVGSADSGLGGDFPMLPAYTYLNGLNIAASFISNTKMRTTPSISEIGNGIRVYGQGTNGDVASIFTIGTADDTNVIVFSLNGDGSKDWGDIDHAMVVTNRTGGGMAFESEL